MSCSLGRAQTQTIYHQDFTTGGSGGMGGTAPTLSFSVAGGSSSATWNVVSNSATAFMHTDGTVGANQNSVLLPFTPQSGYQYTLSATISFTGAAGNWVSLGFSQFNPVNSATPRFADSAVTGYDWMIANDATGNNEQFFAGPKGTPGAGIGGSAGLLSGAGTFTLTLNLDTTGSQWGISSFIDGVQLGTNFTYAANPTIAAVGLGQNTLTTPGNLQWDSFDLTATPAPEPSVFALAGVGAAVFAFFRKKNSK
jgi:hypothetical protein